MSAEGKERTRRALAFVQEHRIFEQRLGRHRAALLEHVSQPHARRWSCGVLSDQVVQRRGERAAAQAKWPLVRQNMGHGARARRVSGAAGGEDQRLWVQLQLLLFLLLLRE